MKRFKVVFFSTRTTENAFIFCDVDTNLLQLLARLYLHQELAAGGTSGILALGNKVIKGHMQNRNKANVFKP